MKAFSNSYYILLLQVLLLRSWKLVSPNPRNKVLSPRVPAGVRPEHQHGYAMLVPCCPYKSIQVTSSTGLLASSYSAYLIRLLNARIGLRVCTPATTPLHCINK